MSGKPNNLKQFWQELKRRRVIHVIIVYATSAFVILELANYLVELLNLPARLPTIAIVVLAVGFPFAIILSWHYAPTSEGIEKTKPLSKIQAGKKTVNSRAWKITTYVSFAVIIGLVVLNVIGTRNQICPGDIQSLVILPFENFSEQNVDVVIESKVECLGDSICLQVRVIHAFPEEENLWSKEYRGDKSQILSLYNQITKEIEAWHEWDSLPR